MDLLRLLIIAISGFGHKLVTVSGLVAITGGHGRSTLELNTDSNTDV